MILQPEPRKEHRGKYFQRKYSEKKKVRACHFAVFKDVLLKCNTVEESGIL